MERAAFEFDRWLEFRRVVFRLLRLQDLERQLVRVGEQSAADGVRVEIARVQKQQKALAFFRSQGLLELPKIGRASCRECVVSPWVAVPWEYEGRYLRCRGDGDL